MNPLVATIERMDARGTLEVEHILRLANRPSHDLGVDLEALSKKLGWPEELITTAGGGHLVPFGSWAKVVSEYCKSGYEGLAPLCASEKAATFVLGLVEELHCEASVAFLMSEFGTLAQSPQSNPGFSQRIVAALNLLLSFEPFVVLNGELEESVRGFLHYYLSNANTEVAKGTALCALRRVGDESTLRAIENVSLSSSAWKSTHAACKRAIAKRIRAKV